ncbi:50S ribosomal protein L11 methyltransferase [Limoniibacter endophyticus]|uniref:Ribosomal protein L11 methyltransferase n=1 Tax=Limoniibacter endophyticus TaxID=1565040 RepID=A0A8J3GGW5_9HYPH|nr:50S ribosomal protein L11 methyltransferase [Limoniibacter endophyticus]GHC75286.1 ribosomal protein L11 methyltransferase [Limoniibacter endophyticus]
MSADDTRQTRLHFEMQGPQAKAAYAAIEAIFEDDGLPVAIIEIDEEEDRHELSIYVLGDTADAEAKIMQAISSVTTHALAIEHEVLPDVDWVTLSLEGLKPVRAGNFVIHGAHDRDKLEEGDIGIEIEAGQAFGTGHHGTTSGCLDLIWEIMHEARPGNALDLGTGSAVLAIAIAKISDIPVLATDIDPVATKVAAENVALNGVSSHVDCVTAEGFGHPVFTEKGPFDLIVANILAGPLTALAPELYAQSASGGHIILSGILDRQGDGVRSAYERAGFTEVKNLPRGEWVSFLMRK